jgi:hypothetical protein
MQVPFAWLEWLAKRSLWKRPAYLALNIQEPPAHYEVKQGIVLRELRGVYPKWAHLSCPRCKEHIQISIAEGPNSWRLTVDLLNRPTITPSIWQTGSCGAHFYVRRGQLIWCEAR